jgi:hypothetical protein
MSRQERTGEVVVAAARRYPARTAVLVGLLVLSGVAESVGVAVMLPLLELVAGGPAPAPHRLPARPAPSYAGLACPRAWT